MSKLISITTGNGIKSGDAILAVKNSLQLKGKKVHIIKSKWIGKDSDSPFVSSIFDTNNRYEQQKSIETKLAENDFVIVDGYTTSTMAKQLNKFESESAKRSYCIWLDSLESITYNIKRADITLLITDKKIDTLNQLAKIFPNDFYLTNSKQYLELLDNILDIKTRTTESKNFESNLLNVIYSLNANRNINYNIEYSPNYIQDVKLQDLLELRAQVEEKLPEADYFLSIMTPLGTATKLTGQLDSIFSSSLERIFERLEQNYPELDESIKIIASPKTELELVSKISFKYGFEPKDITYQEKMRILETWAMHLNQADASAISLKTSSILSLHDIISLYKHLPTVYIEIQKIDARNGFVDTSRAPANILDLIENAFDESTSTAITSQDSKYLLLGHKTNCKLEFKTKDIVYLLKNPELGGSECLDKLIFDLVETVSEQYPVFYETIKNI